MEFAISWYKYGKRSFVQYKFGYSFGYTNNIDLKNQAGAVAHRPARHACFGTIISTKGSFCSVFSGFITIDDRGIGKGST